MNTISLILLLVSLVTSLMQIFFGIKEILALKSDFNRQNPGNILKICNHATIYLKKCRCLKTSNLKMVFFIPAMILISLIILSQHESPLPFKCIKESFVQERDN